jgi:hypothetical protein
MISTFLLALTLIRALAGQGTPAITPQADGFRGIWFALGQKSPYDDKVWCLSYTMT